MSEWGLENLGIRPAFTANQHCDLLGKHSLISLHLSFLKNKTKVLEWMPFNALFSVKYPLF